MQTVHTEQSWVVRSSTNNIEFGLYRTVCELYKWGSKTLPPPLQHWAGAPLLQPFLLKFHPAISLSSCYHISKTKRFNTYSRSGPRTSACSTCTQACHCFSSFQLVTCPHSGPFSLTIRCGMYQWGDMGVLGGTWVLVEVVGVVQTPFLIFPH